MASKELSFNLGAGVSSSSNIPDQEVSAELFKLYNALNTIAAKLDEYANALEIPVADRPFTSNIAVNKESRLSRVYAVAGVALVKGTTVYIDAAGKAQKAFTSTVSTITHTHFMVMVDTALNGYVPLMRRGVIGGFAGLATGTKYFTSTVAGAISSASPVASAVGYDQFVGIALNATTLYFDPDLTHQTYP